MGNLIYVDSNYISPLALILCVLFIVVFSHLMALVTEKFKK